MKITKPIFAPLLLCVLVRTSSLSLASAGPIGAVSFPERTSFSASGSSFGPTLSANGRFVLFVSHAGNLVTNDDLAPYLDVFVHELTTSNTVLINVNTTSIGGGNADANFPSISSNGQFVAFASSASNLVNGDTNDASDIFVRDLAAGATRLVSVDLTGTNSAASLSSWTNHRLSSNPLISANGRWIIFESLATNLVALEDTNLMTDIFARDLQSEATFLISVNGVGTGSGNGNSESASITPDGQRIAFVSTATDLVPGTTNSRGDIYVRDLESESTVWVSSDVAGFFPNSSGSYHCFAPVLSADGRSAAFKANTSTDPGTVVLVYRELQTGVTTLLATNTSLLSQPVISANGRFVASENSTNVYVWDLQTGSNVLVSVNEAGTGPANQASHSPVMSPDARFITFVSAATDITAEASNGVEQIFLRDMVSKTTRLVTVHLDGSPGSSDMGLFAPAISEDGRLVVFESTDVNLVANDSNQSSDIFVRNMEAASTQLVSRRDADRPARTAAATSRLWANAVSANGRFVAFTSPDSNLAADDSNGWQDVFVFDQVSGSISVVTPESNGTLSKQWRCRNPVFSANGRYVAFVGQSNAAATVSAPGATFSAQIYRRDLETGVSTLVNDQQPVQTFGELQLPSYPIAISSDGNRVCFQSAASGLVPKDFNNRTDVFLRDMSAGTNFLVSVNRFGASGNGDSSDPIFSPDDQWVLFASIARDLTTNNTGGGRNLFARNLKFNSTLLVSVGTEGNELGYAYNGGAVVSANSRWVAFMSSSQSIFLFDLQAGTSKLVCTSCSQPSLSSDGRFVAYRTPGGEFAPPNIVVLDCQTGVTNLVSQNRFGNGGGNGSSSSPLLSWDGRFVAFASKASDLVDNDTNGASDIFVRDRVLGTTLLLSLNLQGTGSGNGVSSQLALAADGRTIVFQSFASDLAGGDYNDGGDVFVLRLGGPDSDGDGMEDDWEVAYFGGLARDGSGDFDRDGQSDLQEFRAGTDPTNNESILRVLTVTRLGGADTALIWAASPGKTYRVQFKDNLAQATWNDLPKLVVANGTTASLFDDAQSAEDQRFYRVMLVTP